MIRRSLIRWAGFLGAALTVATAAESRAQEVAFRIDPADDEFETLTTLSAYLDPLEVTVETPALATDVLAGYCGSVSEMLMFFFQRENPTLPVGERLSPGTTLRIPPCPRVHRRVSATFAEHPDVRRRMDPNRPDRVEFVMAMEPAAREAAVREAVAVRRVEPPRFERDLVQYASFPLREEYWSADGRAVALEAIWSLSGALAAEFDAGDAAPVGVLSAENAGPCEAGPASRWPLDRAALRQAITRNRNVHDVAPRRVSIGVVDTGLHAPDSVHLPLWYSTERWNPPQDRDGNNYENDVFGAAILDPLSPPFDISQRDYGHGTMVASLAAGGRLPPALRNSVDEMIGLKILRVDNRGISFAALLEALAYQSPPPLFLGVLNFSVGSRSGIPGFGQRLLGAGSPTSLVVAAAGNAGLNLDDEPFHPGGLNRGGDLPMVSVAAHGWLGNRADDVTSNPRWPLLPSSNYGRSTVDLAAPGCEVPVLLRGAWTPSSGTSLAAPLVSFTAALISAMGETSITRIRRRLLSSVDVVPGLAVRTQGVLNPAKAILIYDDVVEATDGTVRFERVAPFDLEGPDGPVPWSQLLKLARLNDEGDFIAIREAAEGRVRLEQVRVGAAFIRLLESGDSVAVSELADLTLRPPEKR